MNNAEHTKSDHHHMPSQNRMRASKRSSHNQAQDERKDEAPSDGEERGKYKNVKKSHRFCVGVFTFDKKS